MWRRTWKLLDSEICLGETKNGSQGWLELRDASEVLPEDMMMF